MVCRRKSVGMTVPAAAAASRWMLRACYDGPSEILLLEKKKKNEKNIIIIIYNHLRVVTYAASVPSVRHPPTGAIGKRCAEKGSKNIHGGAV